MAVACKLGSSWPPTHLNAIPIGFEGRIDRACETVIGSSDGILPTIGCAQ